MIALQDFKIVEDLKRLINWVDSPRLNIVWASDSFVFPLEETQLRKHFLTAVENGIIALKIKELSSSKVIGHCELEVEVKSVKICRLLIAKKYRGQGYGEETIKKLLEYIKTNQKPNTIFLTVFSFNPAIKLYERMGFEKTRVEKNFMQFENEEWDRVTMVLKK